MTFMAAVKEYLGELQERGLIEGWRLTRTKLGLRAPGLGEWHVMIETRDMAQLEAAFPGVACRMAPVEYFQFGVNSLVQGARFALYRDFPDPFRHVGEERF